MIKITDVGGNEKYINCDLIERIELIPDTLLVLVNGHNFIVKDSPEEIVGKIVEFKKQCNENVRSSFNITLEDKTCSDIGEPELEVIEKG